MIKNSSGICQRLMVFVGTIMVASCGLACLLPGRAAAAEIEPGDTVITLRRTPLKVGDETLATIPAKSRLLMMDVKGEFGAVTIQQIGKEVSGWVYTKHVRLTLDPPPRAEYPVLLHVVEGKRAGDPPKLYYSRRQAEKVLGTRLPKEGLMSAFAMMLYVIQCEENPRVTGQLRGTMGIMPMTARIPIVLNTLPRGFHGAALSGSKEGEEEQSQLSNWVVFEIK